MSQIDINSIMNFLWQNSVFSISVILINFILCWFLYDKIIVGKISLKESLFEKDNLASWIEYIGAFILPTFYLTSKAVAGSVNSVLYKDLLYCIGYTIIYIILFAFFRMFSGAIVKLMNAEDGNGKIELNNEIYKQKNIAAAVFSVSLAFIFANIVSFLDIIPGFFITSVYKMLSVLVLSLFALLIYILVLRRKTTLFKEIFVDNNPAAAVSFLGFVIAIENILATSITYKAEYNYIISIILAVICMVLFAVLSTFIKLLFAKILKIDFVKEVYEQDNVGAGIGIAVLYFGVSSIILHFLF
jgi:hypothetical protein